MSCKMGARTAWVCCWDATVTGEAQHVLACHQTTDSCAVLPMLCCLFTVFSVGCAVLWLPGVVPACPVMCLHPAVTVQR
jgi:hypothetical protein